VRSYASAVSCERCVALYSLDRSLSDSAGASTSQTLAESCGRRLRAGLRSGPGKGRRSGGIRALGCGNLEFKYWSSSTSLVTRV